MGWPNAAGDATLGYSALAPAPAGEAPTQPVRQRLLRQVAEALAADAALVPLYRVVAGYAQPPGLEFSPRLDRRIRAQDLRWTSSPPGARLP